MSQACANLSALPSWNRPYGVVNHVINVRCVSNSTEWAEGHTIHVRSTLNPDRKFSTSVPVALCP
jgi:hypothetical protein